MEDKRRGFKAECQYGKKLVFAFLEDLIKEFFTSHTEDDISKVTRPYQLIRFGKVEA